MSKTDFKKYLPSQKFVASLLTIVIVIAFGFLIKEAFVLVKHLINKDNNSNGKVAVTTVSDIIQEDSNNNGIADWEEYIWGLDPTKNGPENKAFILAKKKSLADSGDIVEEGSNNRISDNEALSRELLATIISLSGSDQLNDETINSISEAIGQQAVAEEIPDKYTKENLKIVADTEDSVANYAADMIIWYSIYEQNDLGSEMTLISQGIANQDAIPLIAARSMADAYRGLAELMLLSEVPSTIHMYHLNIINGYEKLAQTIDGLSNSITDPLVGLKSILLYNKINQDMESNMANLQKKFSTE